LYDLINIPKGESLGSINITKDDVKEPKGCVGIVSSDYHVWCAVEKDLFIFQKTLDLKKVARDYSKLFTIISTLLNH
jgi:hypothetical protein